MEEAHQGTSSEGTAPSAVDAALGATAMATSAAVSAIRTLLVAPRSDRHASMASEVVRDARMQSIEADLAIARLVDRLIRRPPRRPSHPSASRAAHGRAG
jgi:hypothetical protein